MPAFHACLVVDWSAANRPARGPDSIWIGGIARGADGAFQGIGPVNLATRQAAFDWLAAHLPGLLGQGRVLLGFDFPLGYPVGLAERLGLGGQGLLWRRVWTKLSEALSDDASNASNRFALAAAWNSAITGRGGQGPFWGCPRGQIHPGLTATRAAPPDGLAERRIVEHRVPRAQTVWKLVGVGSVGSQALTGIPRVWALRCHPDLAFRAAIWPFETGFADDPRAELVMAEVYPSLVTPDTLAGLPKDAGQVMALSRHLLDADTQGLLDALLRAGETLTEDERRAAVEEEGWILGVA